MKSFITLLFIISITSQAQENSLKYISVENQVKCALRIEAGYRKMTAESLGLGNLTGTQCKLVSNTRAECIFTYEKQLNKNQKLLSTVFADLSYLDEILGEHINYLNLNQKIIN